MSGPWLHDIDPIALDLGFWAVHWYGLMYLFGFVAFLLLGWWRARDPRWGMDRDAVSDLLFWGVFGVIVGGRLGYVVFYAFGELLRDPLMLLRVWEGGMSFHGGLLGAITATWLWCRQTGRPLFGVLDFVAPLCTPGLGLGRIGNFIGGELWGKHTDGSWGVVFPQALEPPMSRAELEAAMAAGLLDHEARHPSQLYQAGLEGLALFALLWWFSSKPRPRMAVSAMFLLGYGVFRFLVEFVREPDAHLGYIAFGWLTMGQLLTLPLLVGGAVLLWLAYRRSPEGG